MQMIRNPIQIQYGAIINGLPCVWEGGCYGHFGNGGSFGMIPTYAGPVLEFQQHTAKSESHMQQQLIPTWDKLVGAI